MMALKKAIEISSDLCTAYPSRINPDEYDALNLLIEAGKFLEQLRENIPRGQEHRLPGEEDSDA